MVILTYDINVGLQDPAVVAAKVSAIVFDQGELELIGATIVSTQVLVIGNIVRVVIVLEFTAEGELLFPTDEDKIAATSELFKNVFAMQTPAVVIPGEPVPIPDGCLVLGLDAAIGVTTFGGSVSEWVPFLGTAAEFAQIAVLPTSIILDPNWGRSSVEFVGTTLLSTDAPGFWSFLHDGTGMTLIISARPTGAATQTLFSTFDGGAGNVGVRLLYNGTTGTWTFEIGNGVAVQSVSSAAIYPPDVNYTIVVKQDGDTLSITVNGTEYTAVMAGLVAGDPQAVATLGGGPANFSTTNIFAFSCPLTDVQITGIVDDLTPGGAAPSPSPLILASSNCQVLWETAPIPTTMTMTDFAVIPLGSSCATFTFEMENIADGIEYLIHWKNAEGVETVQSAIDSGNIDNTTEPMEVPLEFTRFQSPTGPAGENNFDHTVAIPAGKTEVGLEIITLAAVPGDVRITVCFS